MDFDDDFEENTAGGESGSTASEDFSLPKQTVAKLVQELLPDGFLCPRDTRDLLVACCTEFIHLIASEANEACEKAGRKTIGPEHLLEALKNLGFAEYCKEVEAAWNDQQEMAKARAERQKSIKSLGAGKGEGEGGEKITEEELARQQEELFEKARQKFNSTNSNS